MRNWQRWIPAIILGLGCLLSGWLVAHQSGPVPLRAPIASVAPSADGLVGRDHPISDDERRVAGMSSFMLRDYVGPLGPLTDETFSIYVGYYDEQREGKTIHSPKNCLPGSGWDPVQAGIVTLDTPAGPVVVNRYRIVKGPATAIVYYWYQGRGRVAHDELRVKYELLRDAALHGRTEEALVRVVVMVRKDDIAGAEQIASRVATPLVADVDRILPRL